MDQSLIDALKADTPEDLKEAGDTTLQEANKLLEDDGKEPINDVTTYLECDEKRLKGRSAKQYTADIFDKQLLRADAMVDTFFAGSFQDFECVEDIHDYILEVADKRIPRKDGEELVILPPLFIQSSKSGTLRFMIEKDTMIVRAPMEKTKHATIMLLFLEQGPIIPVVRLQEYKTFKQIGKGWYEYTGETTPEIFARNFEE